MIPLIMLALVDASLMHSNGNPIVKALYRSPLYAMAAEVSLLYFMAQ